MKRQPEERRIRRELKTLDAMVRMYCRDNHDVGKSLCPECSDLLSYAGQRLDACPLKPGKPSCLQCTVHCYRNEMRERVRTAMRYSGPRMVRRHPVLALLHLIDEHRYRTGSSPG
jgi:hypothetical protein